MKHMKPEQFGRALDTSGEGVLSSDARQLLSRLDGARRAFTTRHVDLADAFALNSESNPNPGDVLLARVKSIGHHARLESPQGRRQALYCGDEIIVAYGNRYATDQFDAVVPDDLGPCDLVAGGGVAARARAKHGSVKSPTRIQPIGLLVGRDGEVINLRRYRTIGITEVDPLCQVIVVVGTAMNAGKTTTAATLIRGLTRAGLKVGAAKITGTGSGGDIWSMVDAGARVALDFTDAGHVSTAGLSVQQLLNDGLALIRHVSRGNDFAIIEIADGLLQAETAALLSEPRLAAVIDKVILAAGDAMGASFGYNWLVDKGLPLAFIAGCIGSSPLGRSEASAETGLHVATLAELGDAEAAPRLCFSETSVVRLV